MPCAYAWKTCLCDASSARTLGASSHRAAVDMAMLIPNTQEGHRATRTRIALYSSSFLNLRLSFLFVAFSRDAVFRNLAAIRYAFLEALKTARACWNKENPTPDSRHHSNNNHHNHQQTSPTPQQTPLQMKVLRLDGVVFHCARWRAGERRQDFVLAAVPADEHRS